MPALLDARLPLDAPSAAQRAAEAAALAAGAGSLILHQHAFHCVQTAGVVAAAAKQKAAAAAAAEAKQ